MHVRHLGFRPGDPAKVAFLSCWMGDGGALEYPEGLAFSVLDRRGTYRVYVEGIGRSYPFPIADEVWRKAFTVSARRFYHQRSGIEPESPWENGYLESLNGKLRDKLLSVEIFDTLLAVQVLVERWQRQYDTVRPHSALNYRPPAPEVVQLWTPGCATLCLSPNAAQAESMR